MKSKDLKKRLITSVPLIFLLGLSFYYSYILITSLFFISLISFVEFKRLMSKIFKKKDIKTILCKFSTNSLCAIYLALFSLLIFYSIIDQYMKLKIFYMFVVCIFSDIGGLIFGRTFKGRKLTKISPNKTVSGSIGSFILSLMLVPIFYFIMNDQFSEMFLLILITFFVSFCCQIGDLLVSFLKRKAKVKDTGNILPGHGGLLDRIDGMLIALPLGIVFWKFLI